MKFICIRECTWFKPDFDSPRRLVPDGGRTIYELQSTAPRHLFQPLDELRGPAPVAPELALQELKDGQAPTQSQDTPEETLPERNPNPWALSPRDSLLAKTHEELLKIAQEYKVVEPEKLPNKTALAEAILLQAGYTGEAVTGVKLEAEPTPAEATAQPVAPAAPAPPAAAPTAPEGTPAEDPLVELLNKSKAELMDLAAELGIDKPERLGNKQNLATAILETRLQLTKGTPPV